MRGGQTTRAWASGRDIYGLSSLTIAESAARLAASSFVGAGVLAPATAFDARDMLDTFRGSGRFAFNYATEGTATAPS